MKVTVIIPAYNVAKIIAEVIARIPPDIVDEIIVLDDCSSDNTLAVLSAIPGLIVLRHKENRGYGGAVITLYEAAMKRGADTIILMDADGGHLPEEIPLILTPILAGRAEVVSGSRIAGILQNAPKVVGSRFFGALVDGPMPPLRLLGHIGLREIHNLFFGANLQTWNCGFRAVTRNAIESLQYHSFNFGYLFCPEFLLAAHLADLIIEEVPTSSYYDPRVESANEPFSYGMKALWFTVTRGISLRFVSKNAEKSIK